MLLTTDTPTPTCARIGQLSELLFALQKELGPGPYDVMGTSMGGAIAINFVRLHPQHLRKLVLIAPAGLPVHVPATAKLAQLPLIGARLGGSMRARMVKRTLPC